MSRRSFRIGRSITGLGLFAVRPIKKHEKIAEYKGPRISAKEALRLERRGNRYLYEINPRVTIDGSPRRNIARYANHSCNPNAETYTYGGRVFIRAMRKIKAGRGNHLRLRKRLSETCDRALALQMQPLPQATRTQAARSTRLEKATHGAAARARSEHSLEIPIRNLVGVTPSLE